MVAPLQQPRTFAITQSDASKRTPVQAGRRAIGLDTRHDRGFTLTKTAFEHPATVGLRRIATAQKSKECNAFWHCLCSVSLNL
jgi:hypothetical protein